MSDAIKRVSRAQLVVQRRGYGKLPPRVPLIARARTSNTASDVVRTRGSAWTAIRREQLRREPVCRHCRAVDRVREAVEVDHIVPLEVGGTDSTANLQSLCHACHVIKTNVDNARRRDGWHALPHTNMTDGTADTDGTSDGDGTATGGRDGWN